MQPSWTLYPGRISWRWLTLVPLLFVFLALDSCPCNDCDSDGYTVADGDCNDDDSSIRPGAGEQCDGKDNDCDGDVDEGLPLSNASFIDRDGDGYGGTPACDGSGGVLARGDCDDDNPGAFPFALETSSSDGIDQDCGGTDAADPSVRSPSSAIQAGLDSAVDGQVIWVGPGTYAEHDLDFKGKAVTLVSTHGQGKTIIDAQRMGRGFYFNTGETSASRLDGFTITNGYAGNGGGMYVRESSPTLTEVTLRENSGSLGAGMYLYYADPILTRLTVTENSASGEGGGMWMKGSSPVLTEATLSGNSANLGGGIALRYSSPILNEVTLTGNTSERNGGGIYMEDCGGIYMEDSSPTVAGMTLTGNTASWDGGAMYLEDSSPTMTQVAVIGNSASDDGGGMALMSSSPTMTQVTLTGNAAFEGGGMAMTYSSPILTQITMTGNSASYKGGGMFLFGSSPTLTQATVAGNFASEDGGGIYLFYSASPILTNTILAYNTGTNLWRNNTSCAPVLRYCELYVPCGPSHNLGTLEPSNFEVDPAFVAWFNDGDPFNDDLHLRPGSPLLDAGAEDVDQDGDTWSDGETDDPDRDPDGSRTDIGALGGPGADFYYYLDEDGDGLYDGWEEVWGLDPAVEDGGADGDGDGLSNLEELTLGTDPTAPDSDGDGFSDGDERGVGADPLDTSSIPDGQGGVMAVTLQVPGAYSSIQAAIDALRTGGRIEVSGGTYVESLRMEQKCVELVGLGGAEETVLDGAGEGSVISAIGGELRLEGVTVRNGSASDGGGFYLSHITGWLSGVTVTGNAASNTGGGMYLNLSSPTLTQMRLTGNTAYFGGGMYLVSSSPALTQVSLAGNSATDSGGGLWLYNSRPTLAQVTLTGNFASDSGGGIWLYDSSPSLAQVALTGNTVGYNGGGMYLEDSDPVLTQVTLTGNAAYLGGGIYLISDSSPRLLNSIVAHNSDFNIYSDVVCEYLDYYDLDCSAPNIPTFSYVDLYALPDRNNYQNITPSATTYNLEPGFHTYDADGLPVDLHLALDSPLIDLGDPSIYDPDDSRSDIGIYGGPGAEDWDRDGDGFYDYFWPGTLDDAPSGFDPGDYDCNDQDAEINPGEGNCP